MLLLNNPLTSSYFNFKLAAIIIQGWAKGRFPLYWQGLYFIVGFLAEFGLTLDLNNFRILFGKYTSAFLIYKITWHIRINNQYNQTKYVDYFLFIFRGRGCLEPSLFPLHPLKWNSHTQNMNHIDISSVKFIFIHNLNIKFQNWSLF